MAVPKKISPTALINKLRGCTHKNQSLASETGMVICFDCGATKRTGEVVWYSPWIWRSDVIERLPAECPQCHSQINGVAICVRCRKCGTCLCQVKD